MPKRTQRIRRTTYLVAGAGVAAFGAHAALTGQLDPRDTRNLGYALVALFEGVGLWNVKRNIDYYPIYNVEKGMAFVAWVALTVFVFTGYQQIGGSGPGSWTNYIWIAILLLAKVLAMEFILRRGINPKRRFLQTQAGLVLMLPRDDANQLASRLAAEVRHNNIDAEYIAEVADALAQAGHTDAPSWIEVLAEEMRERRMAKAQQEMEG